MHLDGGEVGLTSHTRVPAVGVLSVVPSDALTFCTGHAA